MKKILKGSRQRFDDILNKIIEKDYKDDNTITINGCIYELINGSLILIGEEKQKQKDEPI